MTLLMTESGSLPPIVTGFLLPSKQDVFVGAVSGFVSFNSAGFSQKALLDINVPRVGSPRDIYVLRAASRKYIYVPRADSPRYIYVPRNGSPRYIYVPRAGSPWEGA